jgi:hypothetical protein
MENGFPTQIVIPFSDVTLNPGSVSTTAATTFTFPSPVLLQGGVEYAITVISNSNKYHVRYAQIGDEDQNGNRISQQPYNGVLFKSQNASTWTADQNKDLMFTLKRAVFDISATRNCVLRNAALPSRQLVSNPLTTLATATSADSTFTVAHRDHGMKAADTVTLAGFTATNGFTTVNLNKAHTIVAVTRDSYTITIPLADHGTITAGNGGGTTCQATQHLAWNTIHPIIQQVVLPDTVQTWTIKDSLESSGSITSTAAAITANEDYTPLYPKVIKSGATQTLQFDGTFSSTDAYLSPVIDMERCSAITISNRLDNNAGAVAETTASTGSNLAKYVTKTIELQDTSDGIKIYLDINRPNGSFVDVYHKTGNTAATFDAESWVLQAPTGNSGQVAFSDGTTYDETAYDITPAATFTIFAIKIVMRSTGTSYVPKCQDLRAIALKV